MYILGFIKKRISLQKQEGDQNEPLLNTFNTTSNATLTSKNTSTLLEVNTTADGIATAVPLPKITKDVISPTKKAFPMLQVCVML